MIFSKLRNFFSYEKRTLLIDNDQSLNIFRNYIDRQGILGIDTEFNWRTTYLPKLSLLQVVTKNRVFLVDYLMCKNLDFLKNIFEDTSKIIILHSVRNDTTVLSKNLNIEIEKCFDIQIAERILTDGKTLSLGKIISKYIKLDLEKNETNSNWLKRPLTSSQIRYAAEDVLYLIDVYKKQKNLLEKINKFKYVCDLSKKEACLGNRDLAETRVKKLKNASNKEKKIFLWREKNAFQQDVPPSFLIDDKNLTKLFRVDLRKPIRKKRIDSILGNLKLTEKFINDFS